MSQTKSGQTPCTLDEMCFPVELRDNPRQTNREYSKVVTGQLMRPIELSLDEIMNFSQEEIDSLYENLKINPDYHPTRQELCEVDLNYCSPIYQLVPNSDIFPEVERILKKAGIAYSVEYSHTQFTRFYGNFTIEDPRFAHTMKGTKDVIKFIWNFQHSYNGLTKYKGAAGFYRLVCKNGLMLPIEEMEEYNLEIQGKHTSSILRSLKQFEGIILNLERNLNTVKTSIIEKYEMLGGREVTKVEDRIEEVLKGSKIKPIAHSKFNTIDHILKHIEDEMKKPELKDVDKVNDWLIYNGINHYVHDNDLNIAAPEKRRETDSRVLEYMLVHA